MRLSRCALRLAPLIACGCASLQTIPLDTEARSLPATSSIVLKDGQRLELRDGRVTRDSVIGIHARLRRAIPRDSVASVQGRVSPSAVPFVMLGALLAGLVILITTADFGSSS